MRYEVMDVTPALAKIWLGCNASFQRSRKDSVVEKYARDMVAGNWKVTHQGIAFDSKGRLIDGQHRLAAVMEAGIPIAMLVVHDAPPSAYDHVDIGQGRTVIDVLRAQGDQWASNDYIAVARYMEYGDNIKAVSKARTPFEIQALLERHRNALMYISSSVQKHVRGVTTAPVLAAIGLAYYNEPDRVRLAEFAQVLVSGITTSVDEHATTIVFREWLRDSKGVSAALRQERHLKAQRVIRAFMTGERLTKIYAPSNPCYHVPAMERVPA